MNTTTVNKRKTINPVKLQARVKSLEKDLNKCLEQSAPKSEPLARAIKPITTAERKQIDKLVRSLLKNPTARIQPENKAFAKWVSDRAKARELVRAVKRITRKNAGLTYFYKELYRLANIQLAGLIEVTEGNSVRTSSVFADPYVIYLEKSMFYNRLVILAHFIKRYLTIDRTALDEQRYSAPAPATI